MDLAVRPNHTLASIVRVFRREAEQPDGEGVEGAAGVSQAGDGAPPATCGGASTQDVDDDADSVYSAVF